MRSCVETSVEFTAVEFEMPCSNLDCNFPASIDRPWSVWPSGHSASWASECISLGCTAWQTRCALHRYLSSVLFEYDVSRACLLFRCLTSFANTVHFFHLTFPLKLRLSLAALLALRLVHRIRGCAAHLPPARPDMNIFFGFLEYKPYPYNGLVA